MTGFRSLTDPAAGIPLPRSFRSPPAPDPAPAPDPDPAPTPAPAPPTGGRRGGHPAAALLPGAAVLRDPAAAERLLEAVLLRALDAADQRLPRDLAAWLDRLFAEELRRAARRHLS